MNSRELIHSIIQRIATGPELSKSISLEEAEQAMKAILANEISEVQSAIFLIAMRMKRETMEENIGIHHQPKEQLSVNHHHRKQL